jgi:acetyl esterase/lipase
MAFIRRCFAAMSIMSLVAATLCLATPMRSDAATPPRRYVDPIFTNVQITPDVTYGHAINNNGALETLKLDLFQPGGDTLLKRPVIVFAHGGAFTGGDKSAPIWVSVVTELARRGWVAASINYRLDGSAEKATDDLQTAVRWFKANASTFIIDPTRVAVMGSSSGAQMALEASFNPDDEASRVAAGVAVSWQVHDGISPGDSPIAVFEALDDTASPYALAEAMCQQTKLQGNVCEMFLYPTGGHGKDLLSAHGSQVLEQASGFLCRNVLGPSKCTPE